MPDPGIGEQALNKAAEIGLSSQLDEVDNLDVNIKTDPLKLVQGQVDSVTIEGEGLVMHKDLRVEDLDMQINSVAINPLTAAFGKIELTKPTEGSARIVLTQDDINRAFNSEYVHSQLQSQKINVDGQLATIEPHNINFNLPGGGKIAINGNILIKETNEIHQIAFQAVPCISYNGESVSLKDVEYEENEQVSPEITKALVNQTSEILDLRNFDLKGMTLRIQQLNVEPGKLIIATKAYVEQLPFD